jgi:uncharacterized OB-fold protein
MSDRLSRAVPGDHIRIATDPYTEPFWRAAREKRLTACQCGSCGHFRMPPSPYCPECQSQKIDWPTLPGTATVFSFAICYKSPYSDVPDFTYIPVVVDLDRAPGARLVSNLVGIDPDEARIGMKVQVDWNPIQENWLLPIFRKA